MWDNTEKHITVHRCQVRQVLLHWSFLYPKRIKNNMLCLDEKQFVIVKMLQGRGGGLDIRELSENFLWGRVAPDSL